MNVEDLMDNTVGCGLYNYIAFILLTIHTFKMAVDFQGLNFALYVPKYTCDLNFTMSMNESTSHFVSEDQCYHKSINDTLWVPCKKWIYDKSQIRVSLINEFDLICSKEFYRSSMFTMFLVGMLVGYPISTLADKFGRRYILISTLFLSICITLGQIFSYNVYILLFLSFMSGVTKSTSSTLSMTTLIELTSRKYREITITNYWTFYTIGYLSTAGFGYITKNWRTIYFLSLLPSVFYFFYFYFIHETPRWLIVKGKREQSLKVLSFIAKINRRKFTKENVEVCATKEEETGNFFNLFRRRRMLVRCFILAFMEMSFSFAYIGTSTDASFASQNIFISVAVLGLTEIPAGPVATFLARFLGRKKAMIIMCGVGVACLISMPFLEKDLLSSSWKTITKIFLAMGGKLGFLSAWCVLDMYSHELIPTTNRNGGISIIYISSGIGSILSPIINEIIVKWFYAAPCIIYSASLVITIILIAIVLPETRGCPLPQTIDEALQITRTEAIGVSQH